MKKIRPLNLILWLGTILALLFLIFTLLFFVGKWSQEKAKNQPVQEPTAQTTEPESQPTQTPQQPIIYVPSRETPQQPSTPVEQTPTQPIPVQPQPIVEAPKGLLETVFDGLNELVTIKIGG